VDAVACAVGAAAIADRDYTKANIQKIKAARTQLASQLEALGFAVFPSESNFLLAQLSEQLLSKTTAESLYQKLKQRGILVRYFQQPRLADKLRITVGTPEQNAALLRELKAIISL
jgi:histidinol-phosphate aminotransferase